MNYPFKFLGLIKPSQKIGNSSSIKSASLLISFGNLFIATSFLLSLFLLNKKQWKVTPLHSVFYCQMSLSILLSILSIAIICFQKASLSHKKIITFCYQMFILILIGISTFSLCRINYLNQKFNGNYDFSYNDQDYVLDLKKLFWITFTLHLCCFLLETLFAYVIHSFYSSVWNLSRSLICKSLTGSNHIIIEYQDSPQLTQASNSISQKVPCHTKMFEEYLNINQNNQTNDDTLSQSSLENQIQQYSQEKHFYYQNFLTFQSNNGQNQPMNSSLQ